MYELVYCSSAKPDLGSEDIAAILKTARDFNSKNNITGCLLYYKHEFIQILEGEREIIKDLFSRINMDSRHKDITVLAEGSKEKRVFDDWSMAFYEPGQEDIKDIGRDVFADNLLTFSEFAEKGTFTTILFCGKVYLLLQKQ